MNSPNIFDPYVILNIPCDADEKAIQEAFRNKVEDASLSNEEKELVISAYGTIRHQAGRSRFLWDEVSSFIANPFQTNEKTVVDKELLIAELAFLSPWEAGDDTCLM